MKKFLLFILVVGLLVFGAWKMGIIKIENTSSTTTVEFDKDKAKEKGAELKEKMKEGAEKVKEGAEKASDKAKELYQDAKDKVNEKKTTETKTTETKTIETK